MEKKFLKKLETENPTSFGRVSIEDEIAFVLIERVFSMNMIHEFQLSHKGVSKVSERARERSEQAKRAQWSTALQSELA